MRYQINNVRISVDGPVVVEAASPEEALAKIQMGAYDKAEFITSPGSNYDLIGFDETATPLP